jgi:hypothetical protein
MKTSLLVDIWGSGVRAPRILNIGTRCRWKASFTFRPLFLRGNMLWYPFSRRQGGTQSRLGHCGEEKNLCPVQGIGYWLLDHTARNLLTIRRKLLYDYKSPAKQNGCQQWKAVWRDIYSSLYLRFSWRWQWSITSYSSEKARRFGLLLMVSCLAYHSRPKCSSESSGFLRNTGC